MRRYDVEIAIAFDCFFLNIHISKEPINSDLSIPTKIGSKMAGAPTPKWDPIAFDPQPHGCRGAHLPHGPWPPSQEGSIHHFPWSKNLNMAVSLLISSQNTHNMGGFPFRFP